MYILSNMQIGVLHIVQLPGQTAIAELAGFHSFEFGRGLVATITNSGRLHACYLEIADL